MVSGSNRTPNGIDFIRFPRDPGKQFSFLNLFSDSAPPSYASSQTDLVLQFLTLTFCHVEPCQKNNQLNMLTASHSLRKYIRSFYGLIHADILHLYTFSDILPWYRGGIPWSLLIKNEQTGMPGWLGRLSVGLLILGLAHDHSTMGSSRALAQCGVCLFLSLPLLSSSFPLLPTPSLHNCTSTLSLSQINK